MFKVLVFVAMTVVFAAVFFVLLGDLPVKFYIIQSGSMAPSINIGDLVIVKVAENYFPNEVVTFTDRAGRIVTHRITHKEDGKEIRFLTKGDASPAPDLERVSVAQILGKVWLTVPLAGRVLTLFRSSPLILAGGMVLLLVLAIGEIVNVFKK